MSSVPGTTLSILVLCAAMSFARGLHGAEPAASSFEARALSRRPAGLALAGQGRLLLVANHRSGSVSILDTRTRRVIGEQHVGGAMADLAVTGDGNLVLAVDQAAGELVVLRCETSELNELARLRVSTAPVDVAWIAGSRRCCVASLWSRTLTLIDFSSPAQPTIVRELELPMAPREQCVLPGNANLVVADAFGGRLGVVDLDSFQLRYLHKLPAHNIRGLAVSPDGEQLLMPHQILHPDHTTTAGGVHWGGVMSNVIRSIPIARIASDDLGPPPVGSIYYLGYPDRAAGDPTGIAATRDGRQIVAYAGVSEVAISDRGANHFEPVPVGRRPGGLLLDPAEQHVYVANSLSDSISVVAIAEARAVAEIPLGPVSEGDEADRGEALFYDARLSSDGWYSCHSCHTDGHTNGQLNDNLSDGTYGAPKRVLSLLGTADTGPWAWNGSAATLEAQIHKSIAVTMQGPEPTEEQVAQLAAFLRRLNPAMPLSHARGDLDEAAIRRGKRVFQNAGCASCHEPGVYTSPAVYDVNLQDEAGHKLFNPPSLRGVSQRDSLFHDARAASLREVLTTHRHGSQRPLSAAEIDDLLALLESL